MPNPASGIFIFFLSDCGPSTEVANTLYRGGNMNLCVCPQPSSVLELGQVGGGGKVLYDLCHAEWGGGGDAELYNHDTTTMGKG